MVTLTAVPDSGYFFSGWSGDLASSANPDSIVMDTAKAVTATFTPIPSQFTLDITAINGTVQLSPAGGVYDSATVVTLTAVPDSGYFFSGWSGDLSGIANPDSLVMDTVKAVTATFTRIPSQFDLTITAVNGNVQLSPAGGIYDSATVVTLTAIPDSGYFFSGWSGDLSGIANPDSLVMDTAKAVTATFTRIPSQFDLTITAVNGSVQLSPAGGIYDSATVVTLTAVPDSGFTFSGWSGDLAGNANPDSLVMDTAKAVSAIFIPRFTLNINAANGAVQLNPAGGIYDSATVVTLTAVPDPGYAFSGWSGDLAGSANPDSLVMDTAKAVTATFTLQPLALNLKAFLEGPFLGDSMQTTLNDSGLLPLIQPFNSEPWFYAGGESADIIPTVIVDWVLIELRSGTGAETKVAERACWLSSNGAVIDTSGSDTLYFPGIVAGDYFIVLRQRNHLAVMSTLTQPLSAVPAFYDFTTAATQAYGTDALKQMSNGSYALIGGDGNANGDIDDSDKNTTWRMQNGTDWLYLKYADFNLDGDIDALDLNYFWRPNNLLSSQVPGVTVTAPIITPGGKKGETQPQPSPGKSGKIPQRNPDPAGKPATSPRPATSGQEGR